ncbi:hypothetical protein L6164_020030 [Bauhinia variegata]|uniref:Uncharacterized protein n=1 Tax=Bauhinia variegata TaxID=167791 RepID=A0ACB9MYG3_BAUVA|nr:hypothetical protein L6164_020030 [Bauhinia variegata]
MVILLRFAIDRDLQASDLLPSIRRQFSSGRPNQREMHNRSFFNTSKGNKLVTEAKHPSSQLYCWKDCRFVFFNY